jgi:hypothetical protein
MDVTTTAEAGLLHAPDEDQLAFAVSQGRAIISRDTDFLRIAAAGHAHHGIIFYPGQARTIGQVIRSVQLIWEVYKVDEMRNRVEYI